MVCTKIECNERRRRKLTTSNDMMIDGGPFLVRGIIIVGEDRSWQRMMIITSTANHKLHRMHMSYDSVSS